MSGTIELSAGPSNPTTPALPVVFGLMSRCGVRDELMRKWLAPLRRREIRRADRAAAVAGRALREFLGA